MSAALSAGFAHPAFDSQAVFRAAMQALSCPGTIVPLPDRLSVPAGLSPAAAALLLTLADFETPVWLDAADAGLRAALETFVRFHCGAPIVAEPAGAAFALAVDPSRLPPLAAFAQGTLAFPDRSTTLILPVSGLVADTGWRLSGPGIEREHRLAVQGLPGDFAGQWAENQGRFPCGVDVLLAGPQAIAGLPRTTRLAA